MRCFWWLTRRWLPAFTVATLALGGIGLGPRPLSEPAAPSVRPCPPPVDVAALRALRSRPPTAGVGASLGTAFGSRGEVEGRLLSIAALRQPARTVALGVESFISRPQADVVVYGEHVPGAGSFIRAVDLVSGCDFAIPAVAGVVRGALLDAEMSAVYVHSVGEADRADRGVRRVDLATGAATQVLDPLAAEQPFGTTYATLLRWSEEGRELAVQSCGWLHCRTRTYHTITGEVGYHARPAHGELIALTAQSLYVFDGCDSWPCPVLAIDRATGDTTELVPEAYSATIATAADGRQVLTIETPAGTTEVVP